MTILSTDYCADPYRVALYASIVLAGDKGIANEIVKNDVDGYDVVTDRGAFRFCKG